MSTIKKDQILLYCHFSEIIKRPVTSFQSPALSKKHVRNVCHAAYQYLTKFHFDSTQDSKGTTLQQKNSFVVQVTFKHKGRVFDTDLKLKLCRKNFLQVGL